MEKIIDSFSSLAPSAGVIPTGMVFGFIMYLWWTERSDRKAAEAKTLALLEVFQSLNAKPST